MDRHNRKGDWSGMGFLVIKIQYMVHDFIWKIDLIPLGKVFRWAFSSLQDLSIGQTFS
jgi:hypothetical protein